MKAYCEPNEKLIELTHLLNLASYPCKHIGFSEKCNKL